MGTWVARWTENHGAVLLYSRWLSKGLTSASRSDSRSTIETHPCLAAHPDQNLIEMTISATWFARWPRSEVTSPDTLHPDVATGLISAGSETLAWARARGIGRIRDLSSSPFLHKRHDRLWGCGTIAGPSSIRATVANGGRRMSGRSSEPTLYRPLL
ncbi:hypothetical protein BJX62DRAFT_85123 [Aspergillus germanicus]